MNRFLVPSIPQNHEKLGNFLVKNGYTIKQILPLPQRRLPDILRFPGDSSGSRRLSGEIIHRESIK